MRNGVYFVGSSVAIARGKNVDGATF